MWFPRDGWRLEHDAGASVLVSPDRLGRIVLREGAPLVDNDVDAMIRALAIPGLAIENIERVLTVEGERAVIALGHAGGVPIEVGLILFDETYSSVIGHTPGDRTVVRELVISTRVFLGSPRRRRFWYAGPAVWTRTDRGSGDETWLAAGYPAQRAAITVTRALPIAARAHVSIVRQLLEGPVPEATLATTHRGLSGQRWARTVTSDDGLELSLVVVALTDGTYDYFARAIMRAAELATFEELLESIEPVVMPAVVVRDAALLSLWAVD